MEKQLILDEQFYEELRRKNRNMKIQEPCHEEHRWTKENLRKYRESVESKDKHQNRGSKMFFLAETGNVLQNDFLIAAVVTYKKQGFLTGEIMDKLLSYEKTIFRVEVMAETKPGSCTFKAVTYDLLEAAMERNDQKTLKKIKNAEG